MATAEEQEAIDAQNKVMFETIEALVKEAMAADIAASRAAGTPDTITTWKGVSITSTLDPTYDSVKKGLKNLDYSAVGKSLGSGFKCNTRSLKGIGCCDGPTKHAPQQ
jgi:hypothetical protein